MTQNEFSLRRRPNGAWQVRKRLGDGKRLEVVLGMGTEAEARRRAAIVIGQRLEADIVDQWRAHVARGMEPKGWIRRCLARTTHRRRIKGGDGMTLSQLEAIAIRSGGRCEVSGLPFVLDFTGKHPFQPSVDRIDNAGGYELQNVRLVCLAVNYCMSEWGEAVFLRIAAAMVQRKLSELSGL